MKNIYKVSNLIMKEKIDLLKELSWQFEEDMSESCGVAFQFSWKKEFIGDTIILWTKGTEINNVWRHNGQTGIIGYDGKEINWNVLESLEDWLFRMIKEDLYTCATCGKEITKEQISGSHFAGSYCSKCWKKYQAKNSRICGICGSPLWSCCC